MSAVRCVALAAAAMLAACASDDDPTFTDAGGTTLPDASTSATCGAPFGSCTVIGGTMCDDYAGPIPAVQARDSCVSAGGTWADAPCATTGTVGGCRIEQPTGDNRVWCVTTWRFPPVTSSDAMSACPAPAVWLPPT